MRESDDDTVAGGCAGPGAGIARAHRGGLDRAYGAAELTMAIGPHPHVELELGALPPGRGLELGCGEGRQAIWLARRGWRMTAVDFSGVAVERGRRLAAQHGVEVDWRVTDIVDWRPTAVDDSPRPHVLTAEHTVELRQTDRQWTKGPAA